MSDIIFQPQNVRLENNLTEMSGDSKYSVGSLKFPDSLVNQCVDNCLNYCCLCLNFQLVFFFCFVNFSFLNKNHNTKNKANNKISEIKYHSFVLFRNEKKILLKKIVFLLLQFLFVRTLC